MATGLLTSLLGRLPPFRDRRRRAVTETPRWPPFMQGLPHVTLDELMATQPILVARLRETSKLDSASFDRYVLPCLHNYARFVHLLPASQEHHHRGAGGLLRHGLEVAYRSAGLAYATSFLSPDTVPKLRKPLESRWRAACLIAGLCHDLGKPIADLDVSDKSGATVWDPFDPETPYLTDFLTRRRVDNYYLRWRKGRFRNHEDTASMVVPRIIPATTLSWLGELDQEARFQLVQCVCRGNAAPNSNRLRDLVMKADRASVLADMKHSFSSTPVGTVGFAPHRHIIDAMRHLYGTGAWKCNQPGARVFVSDQGVFIAWPGNAGGADVAHYIRENQIPGITQDPDGLADDLLDIDVAEPLIVGEMSLRYWRVTFSVPTPNGSVANLSLACLKIRDPEYLIDSYVPPIPAVVDHLDAPDHGAAEEPDPGPFEPEPLECPDPPHAPRVARPQRQPAAPPPPSAPVTSAPQPPDPTARGEAATPARDPARAIPSDGASPAPAEDTAAAEPPPSAERARDRQSPAPAAPDPARSTQAQPNQPGDRRAAPADTTPQGPARRPPAAPRGAAPNVPPDVAAQLREAFPAASAAPLPQDRAYFLSRAHPAPLLALLADKLAGQPHPPSWFVLTPAPEIRLAYPDCFAACGIETVPKPGELAATALFHPDPMRPAAILQKTPERPGGWLVLRREAARAFCSLVLFPCPEAGAPARRSPPPAASPLTSSFPETETPPPAVATSRSTGGAGKPARGPASPREARSHPQASARRPSAAGARLLDILREVYAGGQLGDEAQLHGHHVHLHPDAVRRFADTQGIEEVRLRELLRTRDCSDVPFPGAIRDGLRFPL